MRKICIKIGTNIILNENLEINEKQVFNVAKQIAELSKRDYFFYIISSGAGGFGKKAFKENYQNYNSSLLTAIGQIELMGFYKKIFEKFNLKVAQILLTKDFFEERKSYEDLKNLLDEFYEKNIIPIINENDPLSFRERSFGDNDVLAAAIAILTNSSKLILLFTLDGILKSENSEKIIEVIANIDKEIEKRTCFKKTSDFGRGGMLSKLRAAKLASSAGIETFIINGLKENSIKDILLGGETGTRILPSKRELTEKQKWMLIKGFSGGKLFIDEGAEQAVLQRKSLLAVGIKKVSGKFREKDYVNVCDLLGDLVGIGRVNYPFEKLEILNKIKDRTEIKKKFPKEIIHSNNLLLL